MNPGTKTRSNHFKIPLRRKRRAIWSSIPRNDRESWESWNARMGWLDEEHKQSS